MQVGQVMAAVTYVTQILMSIMMVSMMFQSISRARASAARIREVLDTLPAIAGGEDGSDPAEKGRIAFKGVSFHYGASGRPVLEGIDLDVRPGETLAILGATGAGKTTLCNLIPRFYDPTQGEILVDGRPVRDYPLDTLRSKIAFVLQKSELFSGTIADNIRWGNPDASDQQVEAAARVAQADEFIRGFKDGYQTVIGEKGASLSGGQKQRLSIARVFLKNPPILIFDEATSALDNESEKVVQESLEVLARNRTTFVIAHRLSTIKNAQKILVLTEKGIEEAGSHRELLAQGGVYAHLYQMQFAD